MNRQSRSQFLSRMKWATPAALALWLAGVPDAPAAQATRHAFLFDLGTAASPVHPGWTQVTHQTVYTAERGFGWERAAQASFDDPVGVQESFKPTHPHWAGPVHNDVLRDGVEDDRPLTFLADVPPGRYRVSVTVGRYTKARHDLNVTLNEVPLATNVDAWGHVWGSQGGVPTRTVAAVADAKDGRLRLTFDCAEAKPDRWKEYAYKEPEGGRLWYLGENKNSVLGIRIQPWVEPRLKLQPSGSRAGPYDRIVGDLRTPGLQRALAEFHAGNASNAVIIAQGFQALSLDDVFDHASLLDCLAGSMSVEDRDVELQLARAAESAWRRGLDLLPADAREADDRFWLATWRAESAQRHRMALEYAGMFAYTWASRRTGLRSYDRYWSAFDLEGALTPEDPLYWKGRLLRGRVAHWCWAEGHWKNAADLAAREFAALKEAYPTHPVVRLYTGERVPSRFAYRCPAPGAPEWARLQHEALAR
jgi:hypothetical protein